MPGGVAKTFIPTREPALKDVFDEWLARVVCFAFSIPPTPFVQQTNRATADTAQEAALTEGLVPLQNWVKGLVDGVLAEEFAAPDLEFAWSADKAADPADIAKIATSYVASGIKTVNEVRGELGLPPVPGGDRAVFVTAQGPVGLEGEAPDVRSQTKTDGAGSAEGLARLNPNHYGPGPKGGQFAPSGEGGDGLGGDEDSGDDADDGGASDDSDDDDDQTDDDSAASPEQVAQEEEEEDNLLDPNAVAQASWNAQINALRQVDPNNPALAYVAPPGWVPSGAELANLNATIQAAAIQRVTDAVMPGGVPIGEEGSSPNVRELPGGLEAAQNLFDYIRVGGTVTPSSGPGVTVVELPGGGSYVTFRPESDSDLPAIDFNVPGVTFKRIHFP